MPALVVCDPRLARQVLVDDRTFDKGGLLAGRGRELFGNGLATCPHHEHRRQRRLIQPAFHPSRMPAYTRVMTEEIAAVTGSWREGQLLDVRTEMQKITARVLVSTMFADLLDDLPIDEFVDGFNYLQKAAFVRMLTPPLLDALPLPGNRRYDQTRERLRRIIERVVADYRAHGTDRGDLLSSLVPARPSGPEDGADPALSDTEIRDQMMIFFFAGMESTATTVAWAVHLLARHPDSEARLHAEADAVLAGATATAEDMPALQYAGRVVTETLRLYPPGWFIVRVTTTDSRLGGSFIPCGTPVIISPFLLHRRPDAHPDPGRFDPDRWQGQAQARLPGSDLFPFGAGPRKCIGDTFATTQAVLTLASIAARWRLEPLPGARVRPAANAVLTPKGLRMRVRARSRPPVPDAEGD